MEMRKFHVFGLSLMAVFAFGVFTASSALAVSELLANGATILPSEDLLALLSGELLLEDTGATGKPDILCTGIFDLLLETGTLFFVTDVLMADGTLLAENALDLTGTSVAGDDIECTDMNNVCMGTVLLVAINLPWHLELELLVGDAEEPWMIDFLEEAGKEPAYAMDCNTILGLVEELCDGLLYAALLDLGAGDVVVEFLDGTLEGNCSLGGAKSSNTAGEALLEDTTAGVSFSLSE